MTSKDIAITIVLSGLLFIAGARATFAQDAAGSIETLSSEAHAEEKAGNLDAAVAKYKQIVNTSPTAAAYNNLGRLYYRQMQLDEAVAALRKACQMQPGLAQPRALLGFSYYQKSAFADARRELAKAQQLNPADANVSLYLARSLVELGSLDEAEKTLERIVQRDPQNEEAFYTLGTVHSQLAQASFGKVQTLAPNSYLLELLLGKAAEARQAYAEAADHFRRAIERAPDQAELHYRLAHALKLASDPQAALAEYRRALELNPYTVDASWEAADLLVEENPDEALALVNRALQARPNLSAALAVRARAYMAANKPAEAIADLKKASALDAEDDSLHFQLARAYRKLGMSEQAQAEQSTFERLQQEKHESEQARAARSLQGSDAKQPQ